jgi:DNA repair protein RadD
MQKELRPYQEDALQAIRQTVGQKVYRLVCQAPTGSGKTLVAATIVQGALRKGNRLCFCVPAIQLIDQAVQMFWDEGIKEVGVIQADHPLTDWSKPIQVASIQTLHSRRTYPEAQVVVIDEVHQLHKEHIQWLNHPDWQNVPFIGLSATPWTKGLGRYFHSLLVMSTTAELIQAGYLSKFKVYAADHPDLSGVRTVAGDYHEGQLARVMGETALVANVVETWRKLWNKDKTLLFAVDCAHAQTIQERFNEAGIPCGYQDAHTSSADRAAIKRAFHNGDLKVVANIATLTTGVDWDVRCLQLARPTKSEMLYVQIIGRCLRTADGKDHALILDHTDTTARLGMVTDIHHEVLDDGRMKPKAAPGEKKGPALPKPCPSCAYLIPVGCKKCPECGFERKVQSNVYEREGQLVEISFDGRGKKKRNAEVFPYSYEEKRQFYLQLKAYAADKNYSPKWAKANYREKFKEWPAWSWDILPPADGVGAEVRAYIRFKFMLWANDPRNPRRQAS